MDKSFIVEGSRFYVPKDCGLDGIGLTLITGRVKDFTLPEISCFELLALPHTLRNFVVIHLQKGRSYVVLETKEQIETELHAGKF